MFCMHVKLPLPPGNNPIAVNKYYYYYYYFISSFAWKAVRHVDVLLCSVLMAVWVWCKLSLQQYRSFIK